MRVYERKSIIENGLQGQKIIRDMNKRNEYHSVVRKLDMPEAYNRVSEIFVVQVMRRFGFYKRIIYLV